MKRAAFVSVLLSPMFAPVTVSGAPEDVAVEGPVRISGLNKRESFIASANALLYRGGRVAFRAEVRTRDVTLPGAGVFVRADTATQVGTVIDNLMPDGSLLGDNDWTLLQAVIDVPSDSTRLAYGVYIMGSGSAEARNLTLSTTIKDVPSVPPHASRTGVPRGVILIRD